MVSGMEFILITGRTINQGKFKEHAKITEKYMESVAVCEMHIDDMMKIGVRDGDNIKVITKDGSVVVKVKRSKRIKTPGVVFIPFGPWVNSILPSETEGTGMPQLKGFKVRIEPTSEPVPNIKELLLKTYGSKK
ncbi:MAG: molybdopterin dinucleotide binding domain-containing protein [Candidatus Bathyarchaeia archaeon]